MLEEDSMDRPRRLAQLRLREDAIDTELEAVRARIRELVPPAAGESLYRADGRRAEPWGPEQAKERRALLRRERGLMQLREKLRQDLADEGIQRALPILAEVRVATPCDANWEDMEGDQLVRFCGTCKKHVYNLSEMTKEQAESLLCERADKATCVRIYRRDDGTVISADCSAGIIQARRRKLAALAAAGAAFFTSFAATAAVLVVPPLLPAKLGVGPAAEPTDRSVRTSTGLVHSTCEAPQPGAKCAWSGGAPAPGPSGSGGRPRVLMGRVAGPLRR
jgi:hypothetical protein